MDSGVVAAVLGYEHGIGVRSGCFCAQPYIAHLLAMSPAEVAAHAAAGGAPGAVRMSLGAYSDCGDVDRAVDAVEQVARGAYRGPYARGADGRWTPRGERVAAAG